MWVTSFFRRCLNEAQHLRSGRRSLSAGGRGVSYNMKGLFNEARQKRDLWSSSTLLLTQPFSLLLAHQGYVGSWAKIMKGRAKYHMRASGKQPGGCICCLDSGNKSFLHGSRGTYSRAVIVG